MAVHKKSKSRSQKNKKSQRRGFADNKKMMPYQAGGSPASEIVMADASAPPVMNDYITSPRIRDSHHSDSMVSINSACQSGGSPVSDLVMQQLTDTAETKQGSPAFNPKADMNSLNLYETTGGSRKRNSKKRLSKRRSSKRRSSKRRSNSNGRNGRNNRNNRNNRKDKKRNNNSKRNNRSRSMRGGGSDWIASQYSLGPINNTEQSASYVGQFSQSTATSVNTLNNPPNLGLAGSGYPMDALEGANVRSVGAPIS